MHYRLRINHHADDHGSLMLDGLRPALRRLRDAHGPIPACVRPHWHAGPHLLVGLDVPASVDAATAWGMLAADVRRWLRHAPAAPPIDPARHRRTSALLAEAEGIDHRPVPLRPDLTVDVGDQTLPVPFGMPALAAHRDRFKADTLDDVFALVGRRLAAPAAALIDYAFRLACLHRLAWRDGLVLWPLSLRGQARYSAHAHPGSAERFDAMTAQLGPLLAAMIDRERLFDVAAMPSASTAGWIAKLQRGYDGLLAFNDDVGPTFFRDLRASMPLPPAEHVARYELTPERTRDVMSHPTHFAYRLLVNLLYEMLSTIGFPAGRRFFVCHLVTAVLERHYPAVVAQSRRAGATL